MKMLLDMLKALDFKFVLPKGGVKSLTSAMGI